MPAPSMKLNVKHLEVAIDASNVFYRHLHCSTSMISRYNLLCLKAFSQAHTRDIAEKQTANPQVPQTGSLDLTNFP